MPDPPGRAGACGVNHVARPGAAGPDGDLYFPLDPCGDLGIAISRDEGGTWQRKMIARTSIRDLYPTSVATDSAGDVYIAWLASTRAAGPGVSGRGLPFLIFSRDHGRTWSKPMMVGAPGVHQALHVAVTAARAVRVAISYLGSRSDAADAAFSGYITESFDVLAGRPVFWSAAVNKPIETVVPGRSHRDVRRSLVLHSGRVQPGRYALGGVSLPRRALLPERADRGRGVAGDAVGPNASPRSGGDPRKAEPAAPPDRRHPLRRRGVTPRLPRSRQPNPAPA